MRTLYIPCLFCSLIFLAACGDPGDPDDAGETPDAGNMDVVDLCADVDCSAIGDQCNTSACDPTTGTCVAVPVSNGTSCDDDDLCTENDACIDGTCGGAALDCSGMGDQCNAGQCDPGTGACVVAPANEGGACDDGSPCTGFDACAAGRCGGQELGCSHCGLSSAHTTQGTFRGFLGGGVSIDDCPEGQFVIGVQASVSYGFWSGILARYRTFCGVPTLVDDGAGSYAVTIAPGATVPATGVRGSWTYTLSGQTRSCPQDQVAMGIRTAGTGGAGGRINGLALDCAPLTVTGDYVAGFAAEVGAVSTTPRIGAATPTTDSCAPGEVAHGMFVRSGEVLDGIALRCALPVLDANANTSTVGHPGANPSDSQAADACPGSSVPVGITAAESSGLWSGHLAQYTTQCADVQVVEETDGSFTVNLVAGSTVPDADVRGSWPMVEPSTSIACPADHAITGIAGATGGMGDRITQLELQCERLTVAAGSTDSILYIVPDTGLVTAGPLGSVATSPFGPLFCPAGTLPRGVVLRAGEVLDAYSLSCDTMLINRTATCPDITETETYSRRP